MNGQKAVFYKKTDDKVECFLCPQNCIIPNKDIGLCRVRKNVDGILYSTNFGKITAYHMDPIEKKPLFHFYPGKRIFSIGTFGCNFSCRFCQNWQIAHGKPQYIETTAENLVNIAKNENDNIGIAYTYNEPVIWYEFISKIAPMVHESKLKNVMVTNGYIQERPLERLMPYIDAMNIDLKGFKEDFYQNNCGGTLQPVKNTIVQASKECHVEITCLIIPGLNDKKEDIADLARWLSDMNSSIPLHLSRYYPAYKMKVSSTDQEVLLEAKEEAEKYLSHVYIGNMSSVDNNTYCPQCHSLLVERNREVSTLGIREGRCIFCEFGIYGFFEEDAKKHEEGKSTNGIVE